MYPRASALLRLPLAHTYFHCPSGKSQVSKPYQKWCWAPCQEGEGAPPPLCALSYLQMTETTLCHIIKSPQYFHQPLLLLYSRFMPNEKECWGKDVILSFSILLQFFLSFLAHLDLFQPYVSLLNKISLPCMVVKIPYCWIWVKSCG